MKQHHLFRYPSEWDPRQNGKTKGGYLEGKISLPKTTGNLRVKLSTHPENVHNFPNVNCTQEEKEIHPTLIHVVRKGKGNRRFNEKEPVPNINHWEQEFEIVDRKVYICNKISSKDEQRYKEGNEIIPDKDEMFELGEDMVLNIGKECGDLNLIILIPKTEKRANVEDVSLNKLLEARTKNNQVFNILNDLYRGKNSFNLKKVKLKVEVSCLESGIPLGSAISCAISDTASKAHGAMDLHDATPLRSCAQGGRKVIMIAEFGLAKEVEPRFQLFNDQDNRLYEEEEKLLNQPTKFSVLKESIIFISPPQPHADTIFMKRYKIKLVARRSSDGYVSRKKFDFDYVPHDYYEIGCVFCTLEPDQSRVSGPATLVPLRDVARPGVRKRQMSGVDVYDHPSPKSVKNVASDLLDLSNKLITSKVPPKSPPLQQTRDQTNQLKPISDSSNNLLTVVKTEPEDEVKEPIPFHDLSNKSILRTFNTTTSESLIMPIPLSMIKSE